MSYTGERQRRDDRQANGARSRHARRGVSPLWSMVRDSSATVVSGASRIPFERSSRILRFLWRCLDKPRANTAVAHKLARMVYFMLTRGETFVDQGQQRYEEQQRERSIAALKRRAAALGYQIYPVAVAP